MSTARNSDLFQNLPWRTTTPLSLDPGQLPSEASGFLEQLKVEEGKPLPQSKADVDIRTLCATHVKDGDFPGLGLADLFPPESKYSKLEQARLCSAIIPYRLIDILSWNRQGPRNENSLSIERRPLPLMNHLPYTPLRHWENLLFSAQKVLGTQNSWKPMFDGISASDLSGTLLHMANIHRYGRDLHALKILSNFETAALHLRFLLEGNLDLPKKKSDFIAHLQRQNPAVSHTQISGVMAKFSMSELRLPLQATLLFSPLCLLADFSLNIHSVAEDKLCQVWMCLGGNQPPLLQEMERQVWGVVWDHATKKINLNQRLQEALGVMIKTISGVQEPQVFSWFNEVTHVDRAGPAAHPLPSNGGPKARPDPQFFQEEEEEEGGQEMEPDLEELQQNIADGVGRERVGPGLGGDAGDEVGVPERPVGEGSGVSNSGEGEVARKESPSQFHSSTKGSQPELSSFSFGKNTPPAEGCSKTGEPRPAGTARELLEDSTGTRTPSLGRVANPGAGASDGKMTGLVGAMGKLPELNSCSQGSGTSAQVLGRQRNTPPIFDEASGEVPGACQSGAPTHPNNKRPDSPSNSMGRSHTPSLGEDVADDAAASLRAALSEPRRSSRITQRPKEEALFSKPPAVPKRTDRKRLVVRDRGKGLEEHNLQLDALPPNYEVVVIDLTKEEDDNYAPPLQSTDGAKKSHSAPPHRLFPLDGSDPVSHTAFFHFENDAAWYHGMMNAVEETYIEQEPRYRKSPNTSAFKILTEREFDLMSDREVQGVLLRQHVAVVGGKLPRYKFDLEGLETLAPLNKTISIHDLSIPVEDSHSVRQTSGTLIDLYKSSQSPTGKTLNALDFPMQCADHPPLAFATDVKAWTGTMTDSNRSEQYPSASTRWGLAATSGAYHKWRIDAGGFGAYADCKAGSKVWFVASPKDGGSFRDFAAQDLFQKNFGMELPNTQLWNVEAVFLTPGTRLIMRPNTPHAVYTSEHAIFHGGNFYALSTMEDTCFGVFHTFISSSAVTKKEHVMDSRRLLRRLLDFFRKAIYDQCMCKGEVLYGTHYDHVPDVSSFEGILRVLSLCNLMELADIINPKMYGDEAMVRERCEMIHGRHAARNLIELLFSHYELCDGSDNVVSYRSNLVLPYLAQQAKCLITYKDRAVKHGSYSDNLECTYEAVVDAFKRYCINQHELLAMFNACNTFNTFAWAGPTWSVRPKEKPSVPRVKTGFTYEDLLWLKYTTREKNILPQLHLPGEGRDSEKNIATEDGPGSERPSKMRRII